MDPLDKIFTTDREVDLEVLSGILFPYIRINSEDNSIFFTDLGNKLPVNSKLIIFLLGRKALFLKDKIEIEGIVPKDIVDQTHLKEGSVQPGLKKLRESKLAMVKEGKYFIPNYQVGNIKNIILQDK